MKLAYLLIGAAALSIATGAQAQVINSPFSSQTVNGGIHDSYNTDNSVTDNSTHNAGGAGGVGLGGSVVGSGNSSANISPTIRTTVDTTDVNLNGQDQRQGQIQGQQANNSQSQTATSAVTNAGNSANTNTTSARTDNANNAAQSVHVEGDNIPRQVASAQAPVIVNVASCAMGFGIGAQGPGAGLSIGGARIDPACDRRQTAQVLFQLGEKETALQYLAAGDPKVSAALTLVRSRK